MNPKGPFKTILVPSRTISGVRLGEEMGLEELQTVLGVPKVF